MVSGGKYDGFVKEDWVENLAGRGRGGNLEGFYC